MTSAQRSTGARRGWWWPRDEGLLDAKTRRNQELRLQRMSWAFEISLCAFIIAVALQQADLLAPRRTLEFLALTVSVNLIFLALLLSGLNLRLRDPSMTAAQIVVSFFPAVYVMYFVLDPQARTAYLLLGTTALLTGMFALNRRQMLAVGGLAVAAYVGLIGALGLWAPERMDLRVEAITVLAYAAVLAIIANVGSYIAGLRNTLKERNVALHEAMETLERLAMEDPLTGLFNRRSMMRFLDQEKARIDRRPTEGGPLCVTLLDVDSFKAINDACGHHAGDLTLIRIAEVLRSATRQSDACGRFGGEEFIVALPDTSAVSARTVCERLRREIAELELPELDGISSVSVSLGLAVHRPGENIEVTLRRADCALYRAKETGRNRVELEAEDDEEACVGSASWPMPADRLLDGERLVAELS